MIDQKILRSIDEASRVIGKSHPLYAFVTSNPLSGYENLPFEAAMKSAQELLNARVYPQASFFRRAWEQGEFDAPELKKLLSENGLTKTPEYYLDKMESQGDAQEQNKNHHLDRIMAKWLAAFLDEGLAEWEMPGKSDGFYQAWKKLAPYDNELRINHASQIPATSSEALSQIMAGRSENDYVAIFKYNLAAMPGWTGFINYRTESGSEWQQEYPIDLNEYLAVRLWTGLHLGHPIVPNDVSAPMEGHEKNLPYIWLKAWEKSWQNRMVNTLSEAVTTATSTQKEATLPDAQFAFCIDTRSEAIRRHVENKGNYETFGYAGFFGIAMDYQDLENGPVRKACPPIVTSAYKVTERGQLGKEGAFSAHKNSKKISAFTRYFLGRMKNMLPSAFGYVEGSGFFYGLSLLVRTLAPATYYRYKQSHSRSHEDICEPQISSIDKAPDHFDIPLNEKVAIVKSAFDLTGWKAFAPLVLFVGHGSHSANNPFGSSLDCGACAASPGRHNARMLAKMANSPEVRTVLILEHQLKIPDTTIFIGAEHNTTTDDIVIFDSEVPDSHRTRLSELKANLLSAQKTATQERLGLRLKSVSTAHQKANDWGETRPEWGLAKNAGFIVAPRALTKDTHLDGNCFLHSYDWQTDTSGKALEGIMQGPMVVTQWINNHYYFSTVDNDTFGGGSKITHNITGRFGVVQGNGGDLKMGLPLQSIFETDDVLYHNPLRLSVFIQAPVERITEIIMRNENLKTLLDNEWIYLLVIDPLQDNCIRKYGRTVNQVETAEKTLFYQEC